MVLLNSLVTVIYGFPKFWLLDTNRVQVKLTDKLKLNYCLVLKWVTAWDDLTQQCLQYSQSPELVEGQLCQLLFGLSSCCN